MSFVLRLLLISAVVGAVPGFSQADPPLDSVRQLLINGEADAAIRALQASISANPSGADEHNLLCRVHFAEEHWDAAVTECERSVALNPRSSLNQLWLARAYGEKADHSSWFSAIGFAKKAHTAFEKAVQLDPNSVEARSDLTEYYIEAPGFLGGGIDKAAAEANIIERLEPTVALGIRARIAEHEKRSDEAERNLKKALELGNNPPRRLFDLASFYRRTNRLNEFEANIQQSAQLNVRNDSTLFDSASLLFRSNRNLPFAASLLRRYIDQGTRSEDAPVFKAQFLLGQVLEKTGDIQGAKRAYQSARLSASQFAPALAALNRLT